MAATGKEVKALDLTQQMIEFAVLWAEGQATITEIARQIGVSPAHAYRWAKHPEVIKVKREANKELRETALGVLTKSAKRAAELLVEAMTDPEVTRAQLQARESVLDRIGLSAKQVAALMGEGAEPVVIVDRTPQPVDARASQERRALDAEAVEVTFIEHIEDLDREH